MLTAAEGEYSLSAGVAYNLPDELADSLIGAGLAEVPEDGERVQDVTPNVPAPHHLNDYQEFLPGAVHGAEAEEGSEPEPKPGPAPKRRSRAKKS